MGKQFLDRLSVIDGVAVAVGWTDGALPKLLIDGRPAEEQLGRRYRRPDLVAHFGPHAENYGFHLSAITDGTVGVTRISVLFQDGSNLRRDKPRDRALTGDPTGRLAKSIGHQDFWAWLHRNANDPAIYVLEVGARSVVSDALWKQAIPRARYTGLDYLPGKNVDVVGDAHRLTDYFDDESFDYVISSATFEHLSMPWIAAEEIAKVLKVGGRVLIETHFSFREHELPWNFFQFHFEGLKILFNKALGFEVEDAGFSNPLVVRFSEDAAPYLRGQNVPSVYCHAGILARKTRSVLTKHSPPFDWRSLLDAINAESSYPEGTGLSRQVSGDPQPRP